MLHYALWQLWCLAGMAFFIIEIITPTVFFLNFGLAAFLSAIAAYFGLNLVVQIIIFGVFSGVFLLFLRPFLAPKLTKEDLLFTEKYIGKKVKATEDIGDEEAPGRVSVFGEEWRAVSENGEIIPKGSKVKILRNESITMYVTKI